jgi:hypothetical protein
VLACAGTFVAGDTYSFLAAPASGSTSDITSAMVAARAQRTYQFSVVHNGMLPSSASGAFSAASTLDAQIQAAFSSDGLDWQGTCECPSSEGQFGGDVVMNSGNAIRDTADTTAVNQAARVGLDLTRTSVEAGTHPMPSVLTGRQQLRPTGWGVIERLVQNDPREDVSAKADGPLRFTAVGRDEDVTSGLDDVQVNTLRTYRSTPGQPFLSITAGGFGWKNLTVQSAFQDACGLRVLNIAIAALRPVMEDLIGQRPVINKDGTIEERAARAYDATLDAAFKRAVGLKPGGAFTLPQASFASAQVLRTSQLGMAPRRLDVAFALQTLGFISGVLGTVNYSGVLSLGG